MSFRRERSLPKGGPDGGDGGKGGSIYIKAKETHHTLTDYVTRKHFRARDGQPGRGKNQTGKAGGDLFLEVPVGTVVSDPNTGEVLADLTQQEEAVLFIPGGKGGKGNQHFATPTNRAPRYAQPGLPGEERRLKLTLKCVADVGLIGLPNAGKSTLLSRLTAARPRVRAHPFTTLAPNFGVMTLDDNWALVIADMPGLIQGASLGRGLGLRFLKHIERTRLLLHLLDVTQGTGKNGLDDFHVLRKEMAAYNPGLLGKPQLVVINKIDLCGPERRELGVLQEGLQDLGIQSAPVSALTGEGIEPLKELIWEKWNTLQEKTC